MVQICGGVDYPAAAPRARLPPVDPRSSKLEKMAAAGTAREIAPGEKVPFECRGCGGCCWNVEVPLTDADLSRLSKAVDLAPAAFMKAYGEFSFGTGFLPMAKIRLTPEKHCPFLKANGHCAVHADRPLACRLFPFARIVNEKGEERWFKFSENIHSGCPAGPDTKRRTVPEYLEGEGAPELIRAEARFIEKCRELLAASGPFDLFQTLMSYRERVKTLYGEVWSAE